MYLLMYTSKDTLHFNGIFLMLHQKDTPKRVLFGGYICAYADPVMGEGPPQAPKTPVFEKCSFKHCRGRVECWDSAHRVGGTFLASVLKFHKNRESFQSFMAFQPVDKPADEPVVLE